MIPSDNRTYHFQAEDEADQHAWMSVLINCKEMALMKAFDNSGKAGSDKVNHSLLELQQAIIRYIQKIPGNDRCCDCNSQNGEWIYRIFISRRVNFGCHLMWPGVHIFALRLSSSSETIVYTLIAAFIKKVYSSRDIWEQVLKIDLKIRKIP